MTTWTYTKQIHMDNGSLEGHIAHENPGTAYLEWYQSQVQANLADHTRDMLPYRWVSDKDCEILCVDQTQVVSYMAMAQATGLQLGYPVSGYVTDCEFSEDNLDLFYTFSDLDV